MQQSSIEVLLPEVVRRTCGRGTPLDALLEVMEAMHAAPCEHLDRLELIFDPMTTPERFLPMLAAWVGLAHLVPSGSAGRREPPPAMLETGRIRALIARASDLAKSRGTAAGLVRFLEIATGVRGFEIREVFGAGYPDARPFHFEVLVPATAVQYHALITLVVEHEKPAYSTAGLVLPQHSEHVS